MSDTSTLVADCSSTVPCVVIAIHDLEPDSSVNVGDCVFNELVDLTFSVICMILAVNLDIALTVGLPKQKVRYSFVPQVREGITICPSLDMYEGHSDLDKHILSAPNFDLLDKAPMSLCIEDLDAAKLIEEVA